MSSNVGGGRDIEFASRFEVRLAAAFVWAMAAWTVAVHIGVVEGASFNRLVSLSPVIFLAAAVGWFICTRRGKSEPQIAVDGGFRSVWFFAAMIGLLVILPFSYVLFRCLAIVFVLAAWAWVTFGQREIKSAAMQIESGRRTNLLGLAVLCFAGILEVLCLHGPSIDDGFYLSVAGDAHRHPDRAIWSSDTVQDDPRLPVFLPIYQSESAEFLVALVARSLHIGTLRAAYMVMPILNAVICVMAWVMLARTINPKNWLAVTAVAMGLSLMDASAEASPANFAFVHFQEGKALLSSAVVPLICVYAWRTVTYGRWSDALMLAATEIAGVGLSSTGILIGPMVACEIGILCAPIDRRAIGRLARVAMACVYPFAVALLMRHRMEAVTWVSHYEMQSAEKVVNRLFGKTQIYLYFAALLGAWLVSPKATARLVLAPGIVLMCILINPALADFVQLKIFSPLTYWRVFWVVPWLILAGTFICGMWKMFADLLWRWKPGTAGWGSVLCTVALVLVAVQWHPVFRRHKNGVTFGFGALDVEEPQYTVAQRLVKLTPPGTPALAPEHVACWTAVQDQRPPLIFVRTYYTQSLLGPADVDERNRLGAIVDQDRLSADDVNELLAGARRYGLGSIVIRRTADVDASDALRKDGFKSEPAGEYVIWSRPVVLPPS